ncbi:MAG: hypothetical protein AAB862_02195 [Patescibacteria group bacterium]
MGDIYDYAWRMGLKTTYYLRTMAASQVEKSTVNTAEFGSTHTRRATDAAAVSPVVIAAGKKAQAVSSAQTSASEPKLCKIDDPDCEACQ